MHRSQIAGERARVAYASLSNCHLCAHHCGVDRLAGERGPCHAGFETRIFSAQTEVADELELIPTFAIALSGCDLRCAFCITGAESWNPRAGQIFNPTNIATKAERALANGTRSIMILGGEPTIHLPAVLEMVAALPETATLVWKTNAHGSEQARSLLDGLFDIWVADYKFGNDSCAQNLAGVINYVQIVQENLIWAYRHSRLIVRHLIMPGHVNCCWEPVAGWLKENLPDVRVNLRSGFWPAWQSWRHRELQSGFSDDETGQALSIAHDYHLNLIS